MLGVDFLNRIVNTNFTGDVLTKVDNDELIVDDKKAISEDLLSYMLEVKLDGSNQTEEQSLMVTALIHILDGYDKNEKVAKYLDDIDSTLIYHTEVKKMSKREIMCLYMNTICAWSRIFKNGTDVVNDEHLYKVRDLYSGLKKYIRKVLNFSQRKLIDYQHFKRILKKHTLVKPHRTMFRTVQLTAESVCGLPQHKKI